MKNDMNEVRKHVEGYFKKYLPQYTVTDLRRKSYHPDDDYLYMVFARKDNGEYAAWTSWNDDVQSLNFGHYNLQSVEDCEKIFEEFYYCNPQKEET